MADPTLSEEARNWALVAAAFAGVGIAVWRGIAADRQSRATRSQADTARRAHVTEVFHEAVNQLTNERLEIRLGAIFTLRQISEDFPDFEHYVIELLTAYVRERTPGADPQSGPEPDIREVLSFMQSLLSENGSNG